jgi:tRNA A-37 threonylcarbamoyl transferase component Bud32
MSGRFAENSEPIPGYFLIERIGSGGFGEVWKARAPGGLLKAIKIVHGDIRQLDPDGSHRANQELRALQRVQTIRHPYLLSIERYDIIDGRLVIVTELADGNLFDRFDQYVQAGKPGIPRAELLRYMREAAEALDLMNRQHQLQHLDIKPQNLFLIHDHVKVADFGLVKDLQGVRTSMDGGVTPLYAAPETFEGAITSFCDQYSLAIVYQELLTGYRPFRGTTVQQLVFQHTQAVPDLSPLPHSDRPAIAKALAKKPDHRHESCQAFVAALESGSATGGLQRDADPPRRNQARTAARVLPDPPAREKPRGIDVGASIRRLEQKGRRPVRPETPPTIIGLRREEVTVGPQVVDPTPRTAPPEITGNGVLFPALVVGLGRSGLLCLKRLRQSLCERFGGMSSLPQLRLLYVDSDPETADTATVGIGGAALESDEILLAPLNRASHYLKPRRSGRSLIDGWFDPQWLYRIPRQPQVLGQRALGRLVFGDQYDLIAERVEKLLDAITSPDELLQADKHTALGIRVNRPRVYLVAHLGGGTGGGMMLDMAYLVRHKLRFLGYEQPDVVGMLALPEPRTTAAGQQLATANTYAALSELAYFHHPDSTFRWTFDDRAAVLSDASSPFNRTVVVPAGDDGAVAAQAPGVDLIAEFLLRDLTQHFGRVVDARRAEALKRARRTPEMTVGTFGMSTMSWPRKALVRIAGNRVCERIVSRWARSDESDARSRIAARMQALDASGDLDTEQILRRLREVVHERLGDAPDLLFSRWAEPFSPQGWFGGKLDANAGYELIGRWEQLFRIRPDTYGGVNAEGVIEHAVAAAADSLTKDWGERVARMVVAAIEEPGCRMTGAEEFVQQLRARMEEVRQRAADEADRYESGAARLETRIQELLRSGAGRKGAQEFAELARAYPVARVAGIVQRRASEVALAIVNDLGEQLNEIRFCRQRLDELIGTFQAERELPTSGTGLIFPNDCSSLDDAADRLVASLTEEDFRELDQKMQRLVQSQFSALVQICLSTSNVMGTLAPAMRKIAQQFVQARIPDANAAELFRDRHPDPDDYRRAVVAAIDDAAPRLADSIASMTGEVEALCVPPGPAGELFAREARSALADDGIAVAPGVDDIAIYRELPQIALARLPHMGPEARDCYHKIGERDRGLPHTRNDITDWRIGR